MCVMNVDKEIFFENFYFTTFLNNIYFFNFCPMECYTFFDIKYLNTLKKILHRQVRKWNYLMKMTKKKV